MSNIVWKYYGGAVVQSHPETEHIQNKIRYRNVVKAMALPRRPLFVLYPTNYDCPHPTEWWYTINDCEYDLKQLPAKRRYEINKGRKNFRIEKVDPKEYLQQICDVMVASFDNYPEEYKPNLSQFTAEWFCRYIDNLEADSCHEFYLAFGEENGVDGYLHIVKRKDGVIVLDQQKARPTSERLNVNFALLDHVLTTYADDIAAHRAIISNGQRNVRHKTEFNEFLIKYFGFRRVYTHLQIAFPPLLGIVIRPLAWLTPSKLLNMKIENHFVYNLLTVIRYIKIAQHN